MPAVTDADYTLNLAAPPENIYIPIKNQTQVLSCTDVSYQPPHRRCHCCVTSDYCSQNLQSKTLTFWRFFFFF